MDVKRNSSLFIVGKNLLGTLKSLTENRLPFNVQCGTEYFIESDRLLRLVPSKGDVESTTERFSLRGLAREDCGRDVSHSLIALVAGTCSSLFLPSMQDDSVL